MKLVRFSVIFFIMLNYLALGCATAPSQFSESPPKLLSKFDQKLFARALSHQKKGQIEPAIVLWTKFLQRNPNSFSARNNLGLLHYANDDLTQAIFNFSEGLKLKPEKIQLKMNLARVLKVQAVIFEENMEYNEAIIGLRKVVQLSPAVEKESIERQIETLEDRIFEQVEKSNSIEEYQRFLKQYPRSPGNSDKARLWIEKKL